MTNPPYDWEVISVILITALVDHILKLHGALAYLVVGGLCFSEAAFIVAFFIPGETALVFGGVLAYEHRASIVVMVAVAIVSTALGYFVGYGFGRVFGARALGSRFLAGRAGVERTRATIIRRGSWAVVVARFIPVVRAFMPGVAGATGLRFPVFARANLIGAVPWGAAYTLLGYFAGKTYHRFVKDAATAGEVAVAVLVLVLGVRLVHRWSVHRAGDPQVDNS